MALAGIFSDASELTSVYAVEITALQIVKVWTPDPTSPANSYSTPLSLLDSQGAQKAIITGVNYGDSGTVGNLPLTLVASAAAVLTTPGSWYWDQTTLFIQNPGSQDPRVIKQTVTVEWTFFFATTPHTFDGIYYQPLLLTTPPMSLRNQTDFSGIAQISGGATVLDNSTGFFDTLSSLNWDGGQTTVYLGADILSLNQIMPWSDYENIGLWLNDNWTKTNQNFTINNLAATYALTQSLPQPIYSLAVYPNMDQTQVGNPIALGYGEIFGAKPVLIDSTNNTFKLTVHAIYSIDQVREQDQSTGVWNEVSVSVDLSNGQFTYPGYTTGNTLSVDFHGMRIDEADVVLEDNSANTLEDSSGSILGFGGTTLLWMDNASDMVADLLDYIGVDAIDAVSFSDSRDALTLGTPLTGLGIISYLVPSLFINTTMALQDVVQIINELVGSYLFVDPTGLFRYVVFYPKPGEGLPLYQDIDILDFSDQKLSTQIQSQITANYGIRAQDGWCETLTETNTDNQYKTSQSSLTSLGPQNIDLSTEVDAAYWAQRNLVFLGTRPDAVTFNFPWSALLLLPSDQIHVQYA